MRRLLLPVPGRSSRGNVSQGSVELVRNDSRKRPKRVDKRQEISPSHPGYRRAEEHPGGDLPVLEGYYQFQNWLLTT